MGDALSKRCLTFSVFTRPRPVPDTTAVRVPLQFLQPGASYKFEVLQIDVSGNQTIAESEFETAA